MAPCPEELGGFTRLVPGKTLPRTYGKTAPDRKRFSKIENIRRRRNDHHEGTRIPWASWLAAMDSLASKDLVLCIRML